MTPDMTPEKIADAFVTIDDDSDTSDAAQIPPELRATSGVCCSA